MTLLLCCQYLCCPSFLVKVSCHFVYIVIWEKISNYQEEDPINGSNHATCLCRSQAGAVFPGYMLLSFSIKWFEVSSSCWYWYFLFTYSGFDSGYFFSALSKSFFFHSREICRLFFFIPCWKYIIFYRLFIFHRPKNM